MKMESAKIVYLRNCWLRRKEPTPCEVYRSQLLKSFSNHLHVGRDESYKVLKCFLQRMKEASSLVVEMFGRIDTNTGFSVGVATGLVAESYLQADQFARSTEQWNIVQKKHNDTVEQLLREKNQLQENHYKTVEQLLREQLLMVEKMTENKKTG
ncbi:hypothetical protein C5167_028045 [Papaver somniferum]|nr:hypothetical protein C5167_028045 [Papaver somniferum]